MGTTSDKLTYLNTTKQKLKDSINALGGSITNETTFRAYATELDNIYTSLPKTTGEGSNLSLTTLKGRINVDDILGDTQQDKTNGYNISIPVTYNRGLVSGVTWSMSGNTITGSGTASGATQSLTTSVATSNNYTFSLPSGTYTLSGGNDKIQLQVLNSSGTTLGTTATDTGKITFTNNSTQDVYVRGTCSSGVALGTTGVTVYVMLESGSTAHTYEPYTNGASPNPTYPQPINVVTGRQEVVVQNKNFFKEAPAFTPENVNWKDNFGNLMGNVSAVESSPNYYDLIGGQTYTFKIDSYANINNWQLVYISDNTLATITQKGTNVTDSKTFTPSINMRVWYRNSNSDTTTQYYCKAQLELGSTASSYVEHQEQTKIVNLSSKNLFNDVDLQYGYVGSNGTINVETGNNRKDVMSGYIECLSSTTYTASAKQGIAGIGIAEFDNGKTFIKRTLLQTNVSENSITTSATTKYIIVWFKIDNDTILTTEIIRTNELQVEKGTKTTYEPYYNYELGGISTYKNRIFKAIEGNSVYDSLSNEIKATLTIGKWYIEKNIGKYTFTGNETTNTQGSGDNKFGQIAWTTINITNKVGAVDTTLSSKFTWTSIGTSNTNIGFATTNSYVRFRPKLSYTDTEFKNAITGNIMYYPLETTTYEEITDTNLLNELNELEKIMSYNGTTNINISGNLPMLVSVSALKGESE